MPTFDSSAKAAGVQALVCHFDLPIRLGVSAYKCIPVVAVFRRVPVERLGAWLYAEGRPRTDCELAGEVLIGLRRSYPENHLSSPLKIDLKEVVAFDKAAAVIVAVYLAALR